MWQPLIRFGAVLAVPAFAFIALYGTLFGLLAMVSVLGAHDPASARSLGASWVGTIVGLPRLLIPWAIAFTAATLVGASLWFAATGRWPKASWTKNPPLVATAVVALLCVFTLGSQWIRAEPIDCKTFRVNPSEWNNGTGDARYRAWYAVAQCGTLLGLTRPQVIALLQLPPQDPATESDDQNYDFVVVHYRQGMVVKVDKPYPAELGSD